MPNKAVFFDRDSTIIHDPGYINDPGLVHLMPGADLAIRSLSQAGYRIVVVTNQSGIARGMLTEEMLHKIHDELRRQLAAGGAPLDAIYYCPFHPEGTIERYRVDSDLRKPAPGMLLQAARELDLDLPNSWLVGDSQRDIEAGQRAGVRTILLQVESAKPAPNDQHERAQADYTVANLIDAAEIILRGQKNT